MSTLKIYLYIKKDHWKIKFTRKIIFITATSEEEIPYARYTIKMDSNLTCLCAEEV